MWGTISFSCKPQSWNYAKSGPPAVAQGSLLLRNGVTADSFEM